MRAPTEISINPQEALERLADALDSRDHVTTLVTSEGRVPYLVVSSRHGQVAEYISADTHAYWWSWAELIAAVGDPVAAAAKISQVLCVAPEHRHG